MKISEIAFKNVRALPDVERRLTDSTRRPFDVVLVTGPTGSGKTRFLEAIVAWKEAIGAYGTPPRLATLERRAGAGGALDGVWELSDEEARRGSLPSASVRARVEVGAGAKAADVPPGLGRVLSAFSRSAATGKVEYFPASRRLSAAPLAIGLPALSEKAEASMRLTADPDKYGVERAWLVEQLSADLGASRAALESRGVLLAGQAPDSLAGVRSAIARLMPHLRLAGLQGGSRPGVCFSRAGRFGGDRSEVELSDLSGGEEQAVLFAAAFGRLGLSRSLVLIDTPELFVHPDEHARFFGALCALGADNQVIASTCSPGILASVRPEQIIDLGASGRAP